MSDAPKHLRPRSPPNSGPPAANRFLAEIGPASWTRLRPYLGEVQLRAGRTALRRGGEDATAYFPTSAVLSDMVVLQDGRSIEAALVGNETGCGLAEVMSQGSTWMHLVVQAKGHAFTLPAKQLRACAATDVELVELLDRHNRLALFEAKKRLACVAHHPASARLASWLIDLSCRVQSSRLATTQEAVSQSLALQRTTITAAAGHLQKVGAVTLRRGGVDIVSREALRGAACECSRSTAELPFP